MQKLLGRLLCVLVLAAVLMPAPPALAQHVLRTNIKAGDVYTVSFDELGGFIDVMISWIKKADLDLLVEAMGPSGLFDACLGLSTQDGVERCHFGQGNTMYYITILHFSGVKKSKGTIWVSKTDQAYSWNRTGSGNESGLRYLGNIDEPGDDPVLQEMARRAAERPHHKAAVVQ